MAVHLQGLQSCRAKETTRGKPKKKGDSKVPLLKRGKDPEVNKSRGGGKTKENWISPKTAKKKRKVNKKNIPTEKNPVSLQKTG